MLRYENGARGMLWASQVAPGNENGLQLRVYGTKGGIHWRQDNPNYLYFTPFGKPTQILTRGGAGAYPSANRVTRIPSGHPEGYLEAFATIYSEAAHAIRAARNRGKPGPGGHFPHHRGRREGRRLYRGRAEIIPKRWCLDQNCLILHAEDWLIAIRVGWGSTAGPFGAYLLASVRAPAKREVRTSIRPVRTTRPHWADLCVNRAGGLPL